MAHFPCSSRRNEETEKQLNEISRTSRSIKAFITRYILNTRIVFDKERVKRVEFGEKQKKNKPHYTILIVGETGTGKSTLINAMVNYMLGVESEDRIWCEIIETEEKQTKSQTHLVTVYDVFTEHCPFSLTFIDTPGFGSTAGKTEDLSVAESLLELFKSKDGVDQLDAVCLVVTSTTVRLTERQHYIFNAVLSLFGNDVQKNIVLFITHAPTKPSNAVKAIKESKVPCAQTDKGDLVYFRFDNSHCENFDDEEISDDYQASWRLLNTTMENFQTFLNEIISISVKMSVAVLKIRKQLTASISNIQEKIILMELKQKELEQIKKALKEHEKGNGDHKNFECEVDEAYKEKVPLEYKWWHFGWKEATCCEVCKENCHYPGCWWVRDLSWCSVMDSDGKCRVCTGQCHYTDHVKEGKKYVMKTRKVKKTMEELKKKYKSEEMKSLMRGIEDEVREMVEEKIRLVEECFQCVDKLEEMALKSDSVYTLQYLDFLIEKVKETGNTDRVKKLQEMKKRAEDKQSAKATLFFTKQW